MNNLLIKWDDPFHKGTLLVEDETEQALKAEMQDPAAREPAHLHFTFTSGVSTAAYPVLAFCVKLSRADLTFRSLFWRTTAIEDVVARLAPARVDPWTFLQNCHVKYEETTDWQLMLFDMRDYQHPLFKGDWYQILLGLGGANMKQGDAVWLKWAGLFPCKETAQAYFNGGVWFDDPTPAFWHATAMPIEVRPDYPVLPTESPKDLAARIRNDELKWCGKLPSECVEVTTFDPNWGYAHHAGLQWFKGKLYATWSAGRRDEDTPGQRVMMAYTEDFVHWSEPTVLAATRQGQCTETCMMNSFLFATEDRLFAAYREFDFHADTLDENGNFNAVYAWGGPHFDWKEWQRSTTDGIHWGEPEAIRFSANESPRPTASGRYIAGCGDAALVADNPDGYNWKIIRQPREQIDDAVRRGARFLTEASWYQTDDRIIHLMFRSNMGYIWHSASYDDGNTWSETYRTNFSTDHTMPSFGRLPDGRAYFIGDPYANNDARFPLTLCLSDDGYNFDTLYVLRDEPYEMQQGGWAKGGYFAYPEAMIHGEYLYVFYSKQKEVMEITRVKLSDIT